MQFYPGSCRIEWLSTRTEINGEGNGFIEYPYFNQLDEEVVDNTGDHQIVPGISVTSSGQATVDPSLTVVLFDLAVKLEEPTNHPVDVEHVLAAIVLAARKGELDPNTPLSSDNPALAEILVAHVKTVFEKFDGKVGRDD